MRSNRRWSLAIIAVAIISVFAMASVLAGCGGGGYEWLETSIKAEKAVVVSYAKAVKRNCEAGVIAKEKCDATEAKYRALQESHNKTMDALIDLQDTMAAAEAAGKKPDVEALASQVMALLESSESLGKAFIEFVKPLIGG